MSYQETRAELVRTQGLRALASLSPCVVVMDRHGTILKFSREAFGYRREDVIGLCISQIIPLEGGGGQPLVEIDDTSEHIVKIHCANGSKSAAELTITRLECDMELRYVGWLREIPPFPPWDWGRQSENLSVIFQGADQSPISVVVTSPTGIIEYVNPSFCRITGYGKDEVIGKPSSIVKSGETPPETYQDIWRTISAGRSWRGELCNQRKNGTRYWENLTISPIRDEYGRINHFIAFKEDQTELRRLRDALEAEHRFKAAILDTMNEIVLLLSPAGEITYANKALEAVFGPLRNRECSSYFANHFDSSVLCPSDEEIDRSTSFTVTSRQNGHSYEVLKSSLGNQARSNLIIMHDITPHRLAEEALRVAKDDAEQANRAKSAFLASMSHELRTPLNAIIGFSDAIISNAIGEECPPRCRDYISDIQDAGTHLLKLINDILDISAIEAGRLTLRLTKVDTCSLIGTARSMVQLRAEAKCLDVEIDVATGPLCLHVDERRITQVLVNLLGNAVKFTPEGGSVRLSVSTAEDGGANFVVADTGVGMDAEGIATAITLFGQVDSTLAREFEGTGLGLPLSQRLVEAHGGSLSVISALGVGTVVTAHLPKECVIA